MSKLKISDDLNLPLEFVTSTQAILAKRRVGKSYTASVQAEEMLKAKQQIVVADPTGAWWGLKSSADGKSPGFPIAVFGGEHADVPLEESAGEMIASAIVADRFSAVLDLSLFRKGQLNRFMAAFLETLYRLNREAMHLFIDEADAVAPQKPFGEEARTLGAVQDVVRRGGIRGIGCTLITQRSAVLNKDVLTQCEVLTTLRLVHPRDIDAIEEWVNVHADPAQAKEMIASLPSLPVGTAWVWSPAIDLFRRIKIRQRETFDSGATPKVGQTIKPPKVLASVDVQKLGKAIAETAERAKENDPKALKLKVATLTAELQKVQTAKATPAKAEEKRVEVPVITDKQIDRLEKLRDEFDRRFDSWWKRAADGIDPLIELAKSRGNEVRELIAAARAATAPPAPPALTTRVTLVSRPSPTPRPASRPQPPAIAGDLTLNGAQRRILNAAAWFDSIGVTEPSRAAVGFVARIKPTGGHFSNSVGPLTTHDLLENAGDGGVRLTESGRAAADPPTAPPTLSGYHDAIRSVLSSGAQVRIFDAIIGGGGADLTPAAIGEATGIDPSGGHFSNSIGPLATLGLIERRGGVVRPTRLLFPESLS